jgi:hypothetical protein
VFGSEVRQIAAGAVDYPFGGLSFSATPVYARIEWDAPGLKFYFSEADYPDPDNPATYDYEFAAGPIRLPADLPFPGGGVWYYAVKNEGLTAVGVTLRTQIFEESGDYHPGTAPVFFPREATGRAALQKYTYNFPQTRDLDLTYQRVQTPLAGQCVYRVRVQRQAGGDPATVPAAGEAALAVKIGLMFGTTPEDPGTFSEFITVTIPADAGSATQDVFWPVVEGAVLAYQCTTAVEVFAYANFMPAVIAKFVVSEVGVDAHNIYGRHEGEAVRQTALLRFLNESLASGAGNVTEHITLPVSATIYNDLEAALSLL